jgi:hypothetical protein
VLCQKLNDDRGALSVAAFRRHTNSSRGPVSHAVGRGRSFPGTLPDVRPTLRFGEEIAAKVAFDRTTLDPRTLPDPFGLLTATNAKESSPFGRLLSER